MYDTMVNLQSGPRVLSESFEMRAMPGNKDTLVDDLSAFSNGFGGEPDNFARLSASKGKIYEFSGMFRRDRQYFDYDLLGNPDIPGGIFDSDRPAATTAPTVAAGEPIAVPVQHRAAHDGHQLTLFPLSKVTFRLRRIRKISFRDQA